MSEYYLKTMQAMDCPQMRTAPALTAVRGPFHIVSQPCVCNPST